MLTGIHEKDLPEARRGFNNSAAVDRWPFIFNDMHELGYKTLYSEDQSTFQYRLNGFDKVPTTKYLAPFWNSVEGELKRNGSPCPHVVALDYLKSFFAKYSQFNKFSMTVFAQLAHDDINKVFHG